MWGRITPFHPLLLDGEAGGDIAGKDCPYVSGVSHSFFGLSLEPFFALSGQVAPLLATKELMAGRRGREEGELWSGAVQSGGVVGEGADGLFGELPPRKSADRTWAHFGDGRQSLSDRSTCEVRT